MEAAAFGYIRQMVKEQAGIIVEPGKEYLAESRLTAVARAHGFAALPQLVAQLRMRPFGELHRRVIESLTTNETSFFRDGKPFEALRTTIVPALPPRPITIWCAAASSGQEPYSVAMMLREFFPGIAQRTTIVASDLSREMCSRTRDGRYSSFEVHRGLTDAQIHRFMTPIHTDFVMKPEVRAMLDVREINLAAALPALPPVDILLARNVLIYFDAATKLAILQRLMHALAPGGVLMLGGGETLLGVEIGLERCTSDNKAVWYRRK
ncbi:MAG: protein-glutamate O-methyltransferase CheR [Kofleriaceae bacterium]